MNIVVVSIIIVVFFCGVASGQCIPFWSDETGVEPQRLYFGYNPYYLDSSQNDVVFSDAFGDWMSAVNSVASDPFSMVEGDIDSPGKIFSGADFVCPQDALGCTSWGDLYDGKIVSYQIDMYPEGDYIGGIVAGENFSYEAVALHEAGHAVGMWHAYSVCATCGELPTMIACQDAGSTCYGCGHMLSPPNDWGSDLAAVDIVAVQTKYQYATVGISPGDSDEGEAVPSVGEWALSCSPNPFNPRLRIDFELPRSMPYSVSTYDLRGRRIWEMLGHGDGGQNSVFWDGIDSQGVPAPSSVYVVKLVTSLREMNVKAVLSK